MANSLINGGGGGNAAPAPPDRSVWMYRAGESKLFKSPDDVPANEGWTDVPVAAAEVTEDQPKRRGRPPKAETPPEDNAG